jgi:ABC-type uncharacterized transport system fused permease/ATPase subunit
MSNGKLLITLRVANNHIRQDLIMTTAEKAQRDALPSNSREHLFDERLQRRYLLRRFWGTAAMFWATTRAAVWSLTAGLLIIIVLLLGAAYAMNLWNRAMFDGLQRRDTAEVAFLSIIYVAVLAISVALSVAQVYARMTLQHRWRAWLNNRLDRSLDYPWSVLSAQSRTRRPCEP